MLIARKLPQALVLVAEDRREAIQRAKELGAEVIFLDDGFHQCLRKFDLLIKRKPPNPFCLPAGPFRLPLWCEACADLIVVEGRDFRRRVELVNPTARMVLVTAIANPSRLAPYLPKLQAAYTFPDHHTFTPQELQEIWEREGPTSLLVTEKDLVKLEDFGYPLSILRLDLEVAPWVVAKVDQYVQKEIHAKEVANRSDPS